MDKYIKGPLLGKGTFGEVIKATHKEVGGAVWEGVVPEGEVGETAGTQGRLIHEPPGTCGSDRTLPLWTLPVQTGEVVAIKKIRISEKGEVRVDGRVAGKGGCFRGQVRVMLGGEDAWRWSAASDPGRPAMPFTHGARRQARQAPLCCASLARA